MTASERMKEDLKRTKTLKLINADTLIAVLEEQKKVAVGYEHAALARIINLIKIMPEAEREAVEKLP